MKVKEELTNIAKNALEASRAMSAVSSAKKNEVLKDMALALIAKKEHILKANKKDIAQAVTSRLSRAFIDRLTLDDKRIKEMSDSLVQISELSDPIGEIIKSWDRPNGLKIEKVRVPIGVIAIIYESRPNVTSDCVGLCFKSGNSVILRGGSESMNSNLAISAVLKKVIKDYGISENTVNIVAVKDRRAIDILLKFFNAKLNS